MATPAFRILLSVSILANPSDIGTLLRRMSHEVSSVDSCNSATLYDTPRLNDGLVSVSNPRTLWPRMASTASDIFCSSSTIIMFLSNCANGSPSISS